MRRLLSSLATAGLVLALAAGPAAPATAHVGTPTPPAPVHYVALGDSYASGLGTITLPVTDPCPHSSLAYPVLLGVAPTDFLACPSATSAPDDPILAGELAALQATGTDATEITVTIGGNDLGFADVLTACVNHPGCRKDPAVVARVAQGLRGLSQRISALVKAIHRIAPKARIFVSGYPRLFGFFTAEACTVTMAAPGAVDVGPLTVARADARWLNEVTHRADERIRAGAMRARAHHLPVRFVSVEPAFRGHGLCDKGSAWINGAAIAALTPTVVPFPQSFHLNAFGEQAFAKAFVRQGFVPAA